MPEHRPAAQSGEAVWDMWVQRTVRLQDRAVAPGPRTGGAGWQDTNGANAMKPHNLMRLSVTASLCVFCQPASSASPAESGLVPFVLPWDDASPGPTDLSGLNHVPAGRYGFIRAGDGGHLYAGDQRIRFVGVNLCFAGTVPTREDAPKIAGRMAKFGINVVRFHHTETSHFPAGLTRRDVPGSAELHPEALDRFDFLVSDLEKRGIYVNINLLVGRPFRTGDGLPREIESLDWKDRHTVGMFFAPMIQLQKRYARELLGHRNPYTKRTYAEDPAVAFVEINNENGILLHWLGGELDKLPKPFAEDLARQWNAWLKKRYAGTGKVQTAWSLRDEPLGKEMLSETSARGWNLERHAGADATPAPDGDGAVRITVNKSGPEDWHVQYVHPGLELADGKLYTLAFRAKADRPRGMHIVIGQAHEPWEDLGLRTGLRLTTDWQEFQFTFAARADHNARVSFSGLGGETGATWIADASLRPGGSQGLRDDETLERGTLPLIRRNDPRGWPEAARTDMARFLWAAEKQYWDTMYRCVKEDAGYKGIVIGTIVACSTPNLQAGFDAVDAHAYWEHPHFPGRPWDSENWTIQNRSMVNAPGGVLGTLAMQRIQGKPFTVTEYNHPAPNTYGSEAPLLLAAQAAFQDWDAIFLFSYNHSGRWDARKITGFFDIDQHPTMMANLVPAALLFRGAQVARAREAIVTNIPAEQEPGLIVAHGRPWRQIEPEVLGLDPAISLLHRTVLKVGNVPSGGSPPKMSPGVHKHLVSDTGEVAWDRRREGKGVVTVDAPRTKAVIGFVDGRSFQLGNVTIAPGRARQDWCTICVSLVEGESFEKPGRALVVTTGETMNTQMRFKDERRSSVGRNWGEAPSLVEVIPATITLPVARERVEAWSLDELGRRAKRLDVHEQAGGRCRVELGGGSTLWYEIVTR